MTRTTKDKRLETMEVQLTPKEWAIKLANEMRSQPSEADFVKIVAGQPYREWPWVKPFFKLCEQAEARCPGSKPENIRARNQSAAKLRTEFHALKKLIGKANEVIRSKAETIGLKTKLRLSILHTLILQDAIGRSATKIAEWAKRPKSPDAEADEEGPLILKELASYTELGLPLSRVCPSLIEDWSDEVTMLLMDVFGHKGVVHKIQEKYFDGRPVLFYDVEAKLAETIESIEIAVSAFNEYLATRNAHLKSGSNSEGAAFAKLADREIHLNINIEIIRGRAEDFLVDYLSAKWVKEARENAMADILQETCEHEGHIWQTFRERVKYASGRE